MFILPGYVLGLAKSCDEVKEWLQRLLFSYPSIMAGVHDKIFPSYASRMKVRDQEVQNLFPTSDIQAKCYPMDNAAEIERQYEHIEREMNLLRVKQESSKNALSRILYARMQIEQLKIPTLVKEAKNYLLEGKSVAVFVNFSETMNTLSKELNTTCMIHGKQTLKQRDDSIQSFNTDKSRIILCQIQSGGVGISLHDTLGKYARVSLISPTWSAQDILQVLGRIYRANAKTATEQRIVFCEGTIEEKICQNMSKKITNIAQLNDGDLLSHQIEGLDQQEHDPSGVGHTSRYKKNKVVHEDELVDGINAISLDE